MKTALVTGAARGIGRGIAKALAAAGFDVAAVDLEPPDVARDSLADILSQGRRALYLQNDIAALASHQELVRRVGDELGQIDCLVNNAGVTSSRRGDMLELSPESFDRCVQINLRGTFFLTQAVARAMLEREAGPDVYRSIVTITSLNAEVVGLNRADYCMTKAALSMATKLYAARLAQANIHVFEIRPGIIRTSMTAPVAATYDQLIENGGVPLGRWGSADDVGTAVATVASGAIPYSTGQILHVGGGLHLHNV